MDKLVPRLVLYSDLGEDSILVTLADVCAALRASGDPDGPADPALVRTVHRTVKRLLDLGTDYGFDENLWQNYLTFVLMTNENSFSLIRERAPVQHGSVDHIAASDFQVFRALFDYDFSWIERRIGSDCFTTVTHYQAIEKTEARYNSRVSAMVRAMSKRLAAASDVGEFYDIVTEQYRKYGVGRIGLNAAFRIAETPAGAEARTVSSPEAGLFLNADDVALIPILNRDKGRLDDLVGYETQKRQLRLAAEAFIAGRSCSNVLLYGDAGTGKSTMVKSLLNEYYEDGLRMIEIYKHQFRDLSAVIAKVKNRNFRFIIFLDDLSFEENEVDYKFLKAVIEGGVESRPENVAIYATSNRRNLIRETWNDRTDMEHIGDIHRSDTVEEKLSLSARFGIKIQFSAPRRQEYEQIVLTLARRNGISEEAWPDDRLLYAADRWERRRGGATGRVAQQFVEYVLSGGEDGGGDSVR